MAASDREPSPDLGPRRQCDCAARWPSIDLGVRRCAALDLAARLRPRQEAQLLPELSCEGEGQQAGGSTGKTDCTIL